MVKPSKEVRETDTQLMHLTDGKKVVVDASTRPEKVLEVENVMVQKAMETVVVAMVMVKLLVPSLVVQYREEEEGEESRPKVVGRWLADVVMGKVVGMDTVVEPSMSIELEAVNLMVDAGTVEEVMVSIEVQAVNLTVVVGTVGEVSVSIEVEAANLVVVVDTVVAVGAAVV